MVVNSFNIFFCNVGKKLADKILGNENYTFLNYLSNRVSQSIYLKPPELNENIKSIHSLNVNKAFGHDTIPAFSLKNCHYNSKPYLQYFFDLSVSTQLSSTHAISDIVTTSLDNFKKSYDLLLDLLQYRRENSAEYLSSVLQEVKR